MVGEELIADFILFALNQRNPLYADVLGIEQTDNIGEVLSAIASRFGQLEGGSRPNTVLSSFLPATAAPDHALRSPIECSPSTHTAHTSLTLRRPLCLGCSPHEQTMALTWVQLVAARHFIGAFREGKLGPVMLDEI